MNNIKSGQFIKEKRAEKNMTQKELAQKLNCTDKAISRWETGSGFPDVSFLIPLSEALGVSVNEIIIGENIEKEQVIQKADETIVETLTASNKQRNAFNIVLFVFFIIAQAFLFFIPAFIGGSGDMASVIFIDMVVVTLCSLALGFMNIRTPLKFIIIPISVAMFIPSTFLISDEPLFKFALPFSAIIAAVSFVMILLSELAKKILKRLYDYKQQHISYHFPVKVRKVLIVLTAIVLSIATVDVLFVAMNITVGVRTYKFSSNVEKYEEYFGDAVDIEYRLPEEIATLEYLPDVEDFGEYTDVKICRKSILQIVFLSESVTAFFEYEEDDYEAQKVKVLEKYQFMTKPTGEFRDVEAHVHGFDFSVVEIGEDVDKVKEQFLIGFNDEKHTIVYAHKEDMDLDYIDSLDDDIVHYYAFPIKYR
ncbi:MAG: helix-turn-helix domain-containing protein [Clostridia bacterium]|nr:helix-turn-helix domain-containing protein [Clostridia bacterium]